MALFSPALCCCQSANVGKEGVREMPVFARFVDGHEVGGVAIREASQQHGARNAENGCCTADAERQRDDRDDREDRRAPERAERVRCVAQDSFDCGCGRQVSRDIWRHYIEQNLVQRLSVTQSSEGRVAGLSYRTASPATND